MCSLTRVPSERAPQLAYSELQAKMLDEAKRRRKAAKITSVVQHFLGRTDLSGLVVLDVGCSAGFIADALRSAGAERVIGTDIDVPGLAKAQARFGEHVAFVCADGVALPVGDSSVDVVVLNHIYEHVVDPDAVVAEIRRVLRPDGVAYFALGNRWNVVEPHYRLPFLSYLPKAAAHRYVRAFGRADSYYETYRTRRGLVGMLRGMGIWDYTLPVLTDPRRFEATDDVGPWVARLPLAVKRALMPVVPTYVWLGTKSPGGAEPAGEALAVRPARLR